MKPFTPRVTSTVVGDLEESMISKFRAWKNNEAQHANILRQTKQGGDRLQLSEYHIKNAFLKKE